MNVYYVKKKSFWVYRKINNYIKQCKQKKPILKNALTSKRIIIFLKRF